MNSKNLESLNKLENAEIALDKLENPEKSESIMVGERIPDICKNAPIENLVEVCKKENEIYTEGFSLKGLDFYAILNEKVKNPIG